ncbi:alpha/beta hydrolase fold domain-containing protein [Streptomyces sp. NPDC002144]
MFFHGGGFIAGDVDSHDELCRLLCTLGDLHPTTGTETAAVTTPLGGTPPDHRRRIGLQRSKSSRGASISTRRAGKTPPTSVDCATPAAHGCAIGSTSAQCPAELRFS